MQPAALTAVLQAALRLLQLLHPGTKAILSAVSRQLRSLVHDHVTSITIIYQREHDTQCQLEGLSLLVSACWPCRQHLKNEFRGKLDTQAVRQLSKASSNKTVSPDLSMNILEMDAMSQLVLGKWPALKHLDLSYSNFDTAAMALLTQADWSLEELKLSDNRIDEEALRLLTKAQWTLRHLDLRHNELESSAL